MKIKNKEIIKPDVRFKVKVDDKKIIRNFKRSPYGQYNNYGWKEDSYPNLSL